MSCPASTSGVVSLQREVRERAQVRLVLDEGLSRVRVRGDGADLDVGMCGEDPEDLAARIAGCAGDGDRICHGFHLRVWVQGPETATPATALLRRCAGSPRVGVRGQSVGARERRSERASRIPGSPKACADDSGPAAASANRAALDVRDRAQSSRSQASSASSSSSSARRQSPDFALAIEAALALVGEGALERLAQVAEATAGRAIGRDRAGREARHVAREPQRQRPRARPVRDVVGGEPLVVGFVDVAGVAGGLAGEGEQRAERDRVADRVRDAVPARRAARDDEVGEVVDVDHLRGRAPRPSARARARSRRARTARPSSRTGRSDRRSDDEARAHDRRAIAETGADGCLGRRLRAAVVVLLARHRRLVQRRGLVGAELVVRPRRPRATRCRSSAGARSRAPRRRPRRARGWTRCRRPRPTRDRRRAS